MTSRPVTPSQTVGPFFHDCMFRPDAYGDAIIGSDGGDPIRVSGHVLDGDGVGVPDAVIEVWHGDEFARVGTDEQGRFSFTAVRPEPVPFDGTTLQAPHLSVAVFARGLLNHLWTRIYFADEPTISHHPTADSRQPTALADPILQRVPETRRATLMANPEPDGGLTRTYRFDIVLQGEAETVFFDFKPSSP